MPQPDPKDLLKAAFAGGPSTKNTLIAALLGTKDRYAAVDPAAFADFMARQHLELDVYEADGKVCVRLTEKPFCGGCGRVLP